MFRVVLMVIIFHNAALEDTNNVKLLKELYETNLNTSRKLDREDRALMNNWTVNFQVKRVNVTTNYRMQMTRHKEHSFRRNDINAKWTECAFLHRREIRKAEKDYYVDESECLTTITADDNERMKAVDQVEKESRKWRKGYRYLVNTCTNENPEGEEAADICLIQYIVFTLGDLDMHNAMSVLRIRVWNMDRDKYHKVIQRLIQLKRDAMAQLYLQLHDSLKHLEECLKTQLSAYLEQVRTVMETLNTCYGLTTQVESETTE